MRQSEKENENKTRAAYHLALKRKKGVKKLCEIGIKNKMKE